MAWVRIHDGAMLHPKVSGLTDKAFRLWVWGLSHSQQYLTDGIIQNDTVPGRLKRAVGELTTRRLWELHDMGYKVHDYLDWNDSREVVLKKRSGAKRRLDDWRETQSALRSGDVKRVSSPTSETLLARSGVGKKKEEVSNSESKWPIFKGQRLVVFDWMLDNLMRLLGSHANAFDLHDWFFKLDERARRTDQVIPQRDGGAWLEAQTLAEAKRRGLPIAVAGATTDEDRDAKARAEAAQILAYVKEKEALIDGR